MELILFFLLALTAIVSAAGMIYAKNAVHSALFLILNFGCVALLFLMLDAPFISMVQIAVYAGAIMVLFLFVIMLLGAEQTTDTEARQFGWLTQAATALGAIFLFAMAFTLVTEGGLNLPEATGDAPQLRIIHAANVEEPVTVTVGEEVFEGVRFEDSTGFTEFEAGDYDVVISDESGTTLFETSLSLEANQIVTAVAYGVEGVESVVAIPNNLEPVDDNFARINVLNLVTEQPLYLVDLGRDRELGVADGEISDARLTDTLVFGEVATVTLPDTTYNLRMVAEVEPGVFDILSPIGTVNDGWTVVESTEQTFIFTPDYESTADDFGYRNTVLTGELDLSEPFGSPGDIGGLLFIDYLLPVNLVGFLLLVALVGVIVMTRPEGSVGSRRSTLNRRRKVSRPLVGVIAQQTGRDVVVDTPKLDEPGSGD